MKYARRLGILAVGLAAAACAARGGASAPGEGTSPPQTATATEPHEQAGAAHGHAQQANARAQQSNERVPTPAQASHAHANTLSATAGPGYTVADVRFMQHMIGHHAQAVVMAGMAPTHGAGRDVLLLAEKIDISQRDEIGFMERWLAERGQAVPDEAQRHAMQMPGLLSPEQMAQLDAARGVEFDRLFLTFMIHHHRGAIEMVETLFDDPRAAQDPDIFRFVTDVDTDQRAEIYVMQSMLGRLATTGESGSE